MNAKKLLWYIPVVTIAAALTIAACKKKDSDTVPVGENTDYGSENARLEKIFIDADNLSDQAFMLGTVKLNGGSAVGSECAVTTVDTTAKKITIDFTSQNCLCKDGRWRRGSIIINYTGKYVDSSSMHVITFKDYYVNDYKVEGKRTITSKGSNKQKMLYSIVDMDGSITSPDGTKKISCTATYTRTWYAGMWTDFIDDDVYTYAGSGVFTASTGLKYNVKTDQAITVQLNCAWIGQGIVEIIPIDGVARVLDYGSGECDKKVQFTVNNAGQTIQMD